jgi:hypothetical protein
MAMNTLIRKILAFRLTILTDLRYATPSPAVLPACALNNPFFLKTKLVPIRKPLAIARIIPTT